MKRLFISTTEHLDNGKAVAYHGVITSHLVAGTGFLSDFAASFSDFFGGRSNSYRRQLEDLYSEALDELSEKAQLLGGNAVLGLRIDMDNIAGKGMSMFMITATGTAATVEFDTEKQEEAASSSVTSALLVHEIRKRAVLETLNDDSSYLSSGIWDFILKNPEPEFVVPLTRLFLKTIPPSQAYDYDYRGHFQKNYSQFLQFADRSLAIEPLYEALYNNETRREALNEIKDQKLFDAKSILKLIKSGFVNAAVELLDVEQAYYNDTDLHDMEALLEAFDNLPDVGKIELVKGGMFSKDGEKYICRHGHKNAPDAEFCSDCNENIKGLTLNDINDIKKFKRRVEVLRDLLSR